MRRRRVAAEWETARFGTTNARSATETPSSVALDAKSLPMTTFMSSFSDGMDASPALLGGEE
jgi:hypothetical protein